MRWPVFHTTGTR
ncbi:hypothetical protein LINPERPRIM_LOCUS26581 [Linum perenne]